jgi:hypothetical protein
MQITREKKPYDTFLPASKCWQQTYDGINAIAKKSGVSMAEVIRTAAEFFLEAQSRNSEHNESENGQKTSDHTTEE